jgi:hypothetical protein
MLEEFTFKEELNSKINHLENELSTKEEIISQKE